MLKFNNAIGYLDQTKINGDAIIDIGLDTVYVRSNIRVYDVNSELFIYDEIQLTYDEYEKYKTDVLLNDVIKLKQDSEKINLLQSENDALKTSVDELTNAVVMISML
jgi:hypothetical protein